jgi:hypothetical protein
VSPLSGAIPGLGRGATDDTFLVMPSPRSCPPSPAFLTSSCGAARLVGRRAVALAALLGTSLLGPPLVSAEEQILTGWLHAVAIHRPGDADVTEYWLTDDQGARVALLIDAALLARHGGVSGLDRQRVTVQGRATPAPRGSAPAIAVLSIEVAASPSPEARVSALTAPAGSVSRPWVTVLCRFGDATGVTPHDVAWFEGLVNSTAYPGMAHYWSEASYGAVNLHGSVVLPWRNLPLSRSAYVSGGGFDLDQLAKDCTAAATADVNFSPFFGINLIFNGDLPVSVGGTWVLALDGPARYFAVTWIPRWGYADHGLVAHEMGHGFGFPHSSGRYGQTYDSRWDVMSNWADNCRPDHPVYGCVGTGTIAHHKNRAGWIPASRRYLTSAGTRETIVLDRLARPDGSSSYLMAVIPIAGSTANFYTVEARDLAGYDENLPARAVIIHEVDTAREIDAQVVDVDRNRNPNDAGAMWLPGETFSDAANGISVTVVRSAGAGFEVTIASGVPTTPMEPDLVVTTAAEPPATAVRGGRFRVTDTVANQGDGPARASRNRYYLSANGARDGADVLLTGTHNVKALAAGAAAGGFATLTVPAGTPPGPYWLLTCTDDLQAVGEGDEGNNCMASDTAVSVQVPDLVATAVSDPPGAASPGARFEVSDSVQNQGPAPAKASRVRYFLSRTGTLGSADLMLGGTRPVAALAPGAVSAGTASVTVPSSTAAGTYYLLACADGMGTVSELAEGNNCRRSGARVAIGRSPSGADKR